MLEDTVKNCFMGHWMSMIKKETQLTKVGKQNLGILKKNHYLVYEIHNLVMTLLILFVIKTNTSEMSCTHVLCRS